MADRLWHEERLLIDGKLVAAESRRHVRERQPGDRGGASASPPTAPAADMDAADRARPARAFDETDWSTDVAFRVRCLRQLHERAAATTPTSSGRRSWPRSAARSSLTRRPAARHAGRGRRVGGRPGRGLRVGDRPRRRRARSASRPTGYVRREAAGVVGGDHAVELPDPDQPGEGRARARRRQHRRAQAGAGHAVVGARCSASSSPRRPTSRRASSTSSSSSDHEVGAAARRGPPGRRRVVHRLDRHRPQGDGGRRRAT